MIMSYNGGTTMVSETVPKHQATEDSTHTAACPPPPSYHQTSQNLQVPANQQGMPHHIHQIRSHDHQLSRSPEGQRMPVKAMPQCMEVPHRDPPPYPAHMLYQAGYRQSFSGSETSTDLSMSSMENLSVCSAVRQEPQGEETVTVVPSPSPVNLDLHYSQLLAQIAASMPASAVEVKSSNATFYVTASRPLSAGSGNHTQTNSRTPSPSMLKSTRVSASTAGRYLETGDHTQFACSPVNLIPQAPRVCSIPQQNPSPLTVPTNEGSNWKSVPLEGTTSTWLVPSSPHNTPTQLRRSYEMLDRVPLTRSQPDLTRLVSDPGLQQAKPGEGNTLQRFLQSNYDYITKGPTPSGQLDHAKLAARATKMVETLSDENQSLRDELVTYHNKVSKLHKLEVEIERLTEQYKGLVKHSQKRENLERVLRFKLETELDKLRDINNHLKDQLDKALTRLSKKETYKENDSELRKEMVKKDAVIAKLLAQNKELMGAKERRDIEAAAQRSTLHEQRAHIQVLNNALSNAQNNITTLEEELRQKQGQQEKLEEMQGTLSQMQQAAEKRQAMEQRLREKLTDHITKLRSKTSLTSGSSSERSTCDVCQCSSDKELLDKLQESNDDRDRHILELETEVLRWEQQYYEESAMRQLAIEAASMPKDARIAALEKSSQETEKIIAEARNERLQHLQEVYEANRKAAELEAKCKSQEAQLAEKEAMISVLQKHSSLSRCSSVSSIVSSPLHSPHPSMVGRITSPLSLSTPASAMPSRHNSQLDTSALPKLPIHTKSNSTGSTVTGTPSLESQISQLHQKLQTQAALLSGIQSESEQLSKKLWQV